MADTPEDGPASEADFEIFSEVEVRFLTVVPGAGRVTVSGQLSQYDVEAIGSERWDKWKWVRAGRYKAEIVGWLCVAGESDRSHSCGSPIELLFAEEESVAREGDSSIQFDCTHVIER